MEAGCVLGYTSTRAEQPPLRMADGCGMAYELSVFPQAVVPNPTAFEDSPYEHLDRMRLAPVRALQHTRTFKAQPQLAQQLGVPDRHAVLLVTRIGYLESGLAVEWTHTHCRSDYCDFVAVWPNQKRFQTHDHESPNKGLKQ